MAIANALDTGFKVTGPVHHFIQVYTPYSDTTTSAGGGIYYLGTAEVQPQIKVTKVAIPVKNDVGGRLLPSQNVYQGQMGQIGVALNRFSLTALNQIKNVGSYGIKGGRDFYLAVGALEFRNYTFKLWQVNQTFMQAIASPWAANMTGNTAVPPGRYWPNVRLSEEADQKIGTIDWTKLLVFEAYKDMPCASGLFTGTLYSEDIADFPVDVQVPSC